MLRSACWLHSDSESSLRSIITMHVKHASNNWKIWRQDWWLLSNKGMDSILSLHLRVDCTFSWRSPNFIPARSSKHIYLASTDGMNNIVEKSPPKELITHLLQSTIHILSSPPKKYILLSSYLSTCSAEIDQLYSLVISVCVSLQVHNSISLWELGSS